MAKLFGKEKENKPLNFYENEWKGMPEFKQEKKKAYSQIIIRFDNEKDLQDFALLIDQKLTNKTKSIWFPFKSHFRTIQKEWSSES